MGTRSVVFVGDSLGVYSHWDGYPSAMIPAIFKMRQAFPDLSSLEDEVVTKSPAGWSEFGTRRSLPDPGEEPMNDMDREDIPDWIEYSYFVTDGGVSYRSEWGDAKLIHLNWDQARQFK